MNFLSDMNVNSINRWYVEFKNKIWIYKNSNSKLTWICNKKKSNKLQVKMKGDMQCLAKQWYPCQYPMCTKWAGLSLLCLPVRMLQHTWLTMLSDCLIKCTPAPIHLSHQRPRWKMRVRTGSIEDRERSGPAFILSNTQLPYFQLLLINYQHSPLNKLGYFYIEISWCFLHKKSWLWFKWIFCF